MPRADRVMSVLVPLITPVWRPAISPVITVAHTRRGARSIVAAASAPADPNKRAVAAAAVTMGTVSAKPSAISAHNRPAIATKTNAPVWSVTIRIDTADTATAPIPLAIRIHRGTTSAVDTPTGANASIGETLYTCRAAIADAATLVSTVAARAAGIA